MTKSIFFSISMALSSWGLGQEATPPSTIDVVQYQIEVDLDLERSFLRGRTLVRFKVLHNALNLPFRLSNQLTVLDVLDPEGNRYSFRFDDFDSSQMRVQALDQFRVGQEHTLIFNVEGSLEPDEYAFLDQVQSQAAVIHREGALLLSEGDWFPNHQLFLDSAAVSVRVSVPLGYSAVGPGQLEPVETIGVTEVFTWKSAREITGVPIVVGRFFRQTIPESGFGVDFFVDENLDAELDKLTKLIASAASFYSDEYGSQAVSGLTAVQVGNYEIPSPGVAGLLLLEDALLVPGLDNEFEIARRVAMQWWGYSAKPKELFDAWLQDGFSTYAALRYFEVNRSEEYSELLAKQGVRALTHQDKATVSRGFELKVGSPEYRSIVSAKGGWVLYMLSQLVGQGELHALLRDWYQGSAGSEATTPDFTRFVREQTGEDYNWFFTQWIDSTGIPEFEIDYTIFKRQDGTFRISGQVKQDLELFRMPMDILIDTKGESEEKNLQVSGQQTSFEFYTETLPVALKLDPKGKILSDSEQMRVAVHLALGTELLRKTNFAEAIREFDNAKKLNPRSSLAHYRLGEVFFEQFSFNSAANSFREVLNGDLQPSWVETWTFIYLGKIYDILGNRERAVSEYQKALNTEIDYNGALAEANKYLNQPYTKPRNVIG